MRPPAQCIDKGPSQELKIKCLSNRSACYKQLSNFDGTIDDCSQVLEVDPENVKAMVRRAQAFEAVERCVRRAPRSRSRSSPARCRVTRIGESRGRSVLPITCRYKLALQDVKSVLSMPGDKVGAANWKLANDMQHRLNRVVAQLKASG